MSTKTTTTDENNPQEPAGTPQDAPQEPTAPNPTEDPQPPQEPTEDPQGDDNGDEHPAAEARKYRLRLRETETERDQLAGRLEAMQKSEAERIAADRVKNPASIWAAGTDLADLLTDEGNIDPQKVKDAANAAAESLGLARPITGNRAPYQGMTPDSRPRGGMADVIKGEEW